MSILVDTFIDFPLPESTATQLIRITTLGQQKIVFQQLKTRDLPSVASINLMLSKLRARSCTFATAR